MHWDGESPGLASQGLQVTLYLLLSASRVLLFCIAPEDAPSALAVGGSSYPSHAPGEGTSPSLTFLVNPRSMGASLPGLRAGMLLWGPHRELWAGRAPPPALALLGGPDGEG